MTALDRAFIMAYRRREAEPEFQPPTESVCDEAAIEVAPLDLPAEPVVERPRWQWPPICSRLARDAKEGFEQLAAEIRAPAAETSPITVAFAGSRRGTGTTSVLLTLARTLSTRGTKQLLLVDANLSRPALRDCLTTSSDGLPESAEQIEGVPIMTLEEDGLSLCTLAEIIDEKTVEESQARLKKFFAQVEEQFPVIVLDAGLVTDSLVAEVLWKNHLVDVAILVDQGAHDPAQRNTAADFLEKHAGQFLGVIETCVEDVRSQETPRRLTG